MKKKFALLCALLCLVFCLAGCSAAASTALTSMENSLEENDPQRAIAIGRDWLDKHPDSSDDDAARLCQKMVSIYRDELADEAAALAFLEEYKEKAPDGMVKQELERLYFELTRKDYEELLPTMEEYLLEGRPFSQWTASELWNWLPVTEGSYSDTTEEDSWYRSESFDNVYVTISWYSGYTETLDLSFNYWGYEDAGENDPLPTLPRGVAFGDDVETVLEKLGFDRDFIDQYADEGSVTLYLNGVDSDLWVSEADPEYNSFYLSLDYDNSDWCGRATFDFWDGTLSGYRLVNQR